MLSLTGVMFFPEIPWKIPWNKPMYKRNQPKFIPLILIQSITVSDSLFFYIEEFILTFTVKDFKHTEQR